MLDERAKLLLKTLVDRYLADGQPVGSRTLSQASGLELSGGLSYSFLGDAETEVNGARARFEGNDAVSAAVRIGWRF